jgi:hypothetical protein
MVGGVIGVEEFREQIEKRVVDARRPRREDLENSSYLFII